MSNAASPLLRSRWARRQIGGASRSALVVVEYGDAPRDDLDRLLEQLQRASGCRIERVRTDRAPGVALADPNEALEFSGYQEGLARVLAWIDADGTHDGPVNVVFANDTAARGHVSTLARLLLGALLAMRGDAPLVAGLKMPLLPALAEHVGPDGYLSTWAWGVRASRAHLRGLRLYAPDEVLPRFGTQIWPSLPEGYRRVVDDWLAPRHLLRGWYQAVPGVPLDAATRRRKELAIYLEHRLSARLAHNGWMVRDASELVAGPRAAALALLRRLDRLGINLIKLRLRLPALWRLRRRTAEP